MTDSINSNKPGHTEIEKLATLRAQIRVKDDEILKVIAERMDLAKQIGAIKMEQHLPIKDEGTERVVLENARVKAKQAGVYQQLAEQISLLLMRYSVIAQDENYVRAQANTQIKNQQSRAKQICVIGGRGRMGAWLINFFSGLGHQVTAVDLVGDSKKTLEEAIHGADAIVLSTPISATASIIEQMIALKTTALVLDICSLKSPLLPSIAHAKKKGLRIASAHPMFGPDIEILAGRNILICDTGDQTTTKQCHELFAHCTAKVTRIKLEDHDRFMGQVLGHSHLCNLVFLRALENSGISFDNLSAVSSTTFAAQLSVARAVAAENPDLYFEIQSANLSTKEVFSGIRQALNEYEAAISNGDRQEFSRLMASGKKYLTSP